MEKMETAKKINGVYKFIGWSSPSEDEKNCVETKETNKFIYKIYCWNNSKIESYRFRK